ncbi:benzoate membrane transport protein [Propionicimonas paludicola]|uniref:Benzoate membrane transport protein n=2 Tax=Propionicimonas paludicola TaxID=185243 RepID=A0A2A9CPP3_9ACTN|nr:benzoate membrane transport protein [Propionicimonas paludicola]
MWNGVVMRRAVVAGLVTILVGYTGAFAVVLTGLQAVGASPAQAASGLAVLCFTMGTATIILAWRFRMPITIAWSTPGAALLASTGIPEGGWPAAVFAFMVTGVLLAVTGLVPWLGRLVAKIPTALAQAMLAGVLVPICLVPVQSLLKAPLVIAPVLVTWLVMLAWKPRWAAATAVGLALVIAVIAVGTGPGLSVLPPPGTALVFTMPAPSWSAAIGLAVPLWLVTMASQNIPGVAVLGSFGYQAPWRSALTLTGLGTVVGAPFGGHAINYAAISAALAASPDAGEDPAKRWRAAVVAGFGYLVFGGITATITALVFAGPPGLLQAAAGVALLGTLGASLAGSMAEAEGREAAVVTFLVAASGISVAGIGAAFWALAAGLLVRAVSVQLRRRGQGIQAAGRQSIRG